MKPKSIIIGCIVLACVGVGAYFLLKSHGSGSASDEDEGNVPTLVSVQTGNLQRMTLHRYVTGYGTVEPAPGTTNEAAADAPLAAPTSGTVAKVNVVEGQQVTAGEVLMTLNSGTATAEYAMQELERQRKLYADHNTSLKALQDAEAQAASLRVVSPLSGTVVSVNVKPGAAVDPTTIVAEVMDLKRLMIKTDVPESAANELQPGQSVRVQSSPPVVATLFFVNPAVNMNSGTISAWVALPRKNDLRPGQFVPLEIVTAVHTNCLAAPEESVVTDEKGNSVISLVQGDQAVRTPVKIGFHENGWTEIEGGDLKAGDTVVTVGAYGLPQKTQIKVVSSSSAETPETNASSPQAQ